LLRDVLAQRLELTAALWTGFGLGLENALLPLQVLRQRLAYRFLPDRRGSLRIGFGFGRTFLGQQIFQSGLELFNLSIQFLGLLAKLHPPQL
jgi:hypothetical protein